MRECERCGHIHAPGYCPIAGGVTPVPRAMPTPKYEEAMRYLGAHTLPTSGSGNMCLFNALEGEVSRDGRLADEHGNAADLRLRAGALMRDGYARHLSRGDDEEWNAHVRQLL